MRHTVWILVTAALLTLTAACNSGPPLSPAEQAPEHRQQAPYWTDCCGGGGGR